MTQTRKLYDIGIDLIENSFTDEDEIDIEQLNSLQLEFEDKVGRCVAFMKNCRFQEDTIDLTIKRLKGEIKELERAKGVFENKRKGIGKYVKEWLERLGMKRVEAGIHKATVAKTRTAVDIIYEDLIDKEFKVSEVKWKVDKAAIKKHFEETGEIPEGTNVRFNETYLLVRYGKGEM